MAARSTFTRAAGNVITSALNNSIRDHLVVSTTSDDVSSNGQVCINTTSNRLVARLNATTMPIAGTMPRCRLPIDPSIVGTASATSGVLYTIPFWTETGGVDTDNFFNAGTSGSSIFAPFSGTYLVTFQISFASGSGTGVREAYILANGVRYADNFTPPTSTGIARLCGAAEVPLTAGQFIQIVVYQDGGTATLIGQTIDHVTMRYLGPT